MRNFLRSHMIALLFLVIVLPGVVLSRGAAERNTWMFRSVNASPLEEARVLARRVQSALPWQHDAWQYFTTAGSEASSLGVAFSYPDGGAVHVLSDDVVSVSLAGNTEPSVIIGSPLLLNLQEEEVESVDWMNVHGHRVRHLSVRRLEPSEAAARVPSWWTRSHRLVVIDRVSGGQASPRVVLLFSPLLSEETVQIFLDRFEWRVEM